MVRDFFHNFEAQVMRFIDWFFGISDTDEDYNYYHSHLDDLR